MRDSFETIDTIRSQLAAGGAPDKRYGGCLSSASSAVEIQAVLFALKDANCVRPCGVDMDALCVPQDSAATAECAPASASCLKNIAWVRSDGLINHPDWYVGSGLTTKSPYEAIQAWLYHLVSILLCVRQTALLPCTCSGVNKWWMYRTWQGSPNNGDCALPCNVHTLGLQFEAVRPSWLNPDVHTSPQGLQTPHLARS